MQKNIVNSQKKWLNENESHYHLGFEVVGKLVKSEKGVR